MYFVENELLLVPCDLLFISGSDRSPIPTKNEGHFEGVID